MLFTPQDLEKHFGASTLKKARDLLDESAVSAPDVRRNGELVTGTVRSRANRYRVYIKLKQRGSSLDLRGECNCASKKDCAHMAAVLLKALAQEQETDHHGLNEQLGPSSQAQTTGTASSGTDDAYPPDVHQRLLYILHQPDHAEFRVQTFSATRLGEGDYKTWRPYEAAWAMRGLPPRFLLAEDRALLAELNNMELSAHGHRLYGPKAGQILQRILATGRCLPSVDGVALSPGPVLATRPQWLMDGQGDQRLYWPDIQARVGLLPMPWYLDTDKAICGPLDGQLSAALWQHLAELGTVPPEAAESVQHDLSNNFPAESPPPLQVLPTESLAAIDPTPCLRLSGDASANFAELEFDYHGHKLPWNAASRLVVEGRLLLIQRAPEAEQACMEALKDAGLRGPLPSNHAWVPVDATDKAENASPWLRFLATSVPQLRDSGWRIIQEDSFSHHLLDVEHWHCEVEESPSDIHLGLFADVDGERLELLPAIVELLRTQADRFSPENLRLLDPEQRIPAPLADGRWVAISVQRLRGVFETLFELYRPQPLADGRLRLGRYQSPLLLELERNAGFRWQGNESLRAALHRFDSEQAEQCAPPAGLRAELRDYQQQGLNWLQRLRALGLAGVLADDMGLGKTLQTLAHVLLEKEQGHANAPSLVIVPTSLLPTWRDEAARFAPGLRVLTLHGPNRQRHFDAIDDYDLVLSTYPLLPRDAETLSARSWHLLILDEAQNIKNPSSQAAGVVRDIPAEHRLCLSGTPLENHLGELWALFDFLLPGLLGDARLFRRQFRVPIEELADDQALQRLSRRVGPFLLRRTKQAVASELPEKTEITREVELSGAQAELYERIRLVSHERVREAVSEQGWERSRIVVLDALLKLRQVCCDPRLVKMDNARLIQESAKLELLMEMLPEMIEEGRRILLFSQFTSMLDLIRAEVKKAGLTYVELTGQTRDRATPVERFQAGEVPLFLISLKAGGSGLNLTAADTVIHYDPWWNPAVERQASDRAHRIGQTQPVFVYKLICAGTVEERIQALQAHKQALADGLFENTGGTALNWNEADLERLFEPL